MIRVEVIEYFIISGDKFNELQNIVRNNSNNNDKQNELFVGDTFECIDDMKKYLMNEKNDMYFKEGKNNPEGRPFVKVIEVIPDAVTEEVVQAVANAIVEEAEEQGKEVKEVVEEIVEESKPKKKTTKKTTTRKTTAKKSTK